ncbi:MAG: Delta-aminolevulinic acid dehydratase [Chlamydiales bacterium]|nr:Delta-aminolevulinic acid dehydratase [Chlamydiales bacterium]MCH9619565.1 Delta-aminolevulinic acid dehydratase [Chlamydiales bacterium]MCH9623171.1 Delta-aminolevulinic acid dehydratase [Chlamydiales bacterium]
MNTFTPYEEEEKNLSLFSLFSYLMEMLVQRPRRNRKTGAIRSLIQETRLHPKDFIAPFFIKEGEREEIKSMPGIFRHNLDSLLDELENICEAGIAAIALFPVIDPDLKDATGSESVNPRNTLHRAVRRIKELFPSLCIITDVALDPYTTHGHDGIVNREGEVLNDETVRELAEMALVQAECGVDMVAPSDMMDGRVGAIRKALDAHGFCHVNIFSYAIKYASSLYAPFRDAVGSSLKFGDKLTYQLNSANQREAMREGALDEQEGADILMVKPAGFYLDVITKLKEQSSLPIGAFQVSGEYAMIQAAGRAGILDEQTVLLESLLSIKRAGADMIFSWGALEAALSIDHIK